MMLCFNQLITQTGWRQRRRPTSKSSLFRTEVYLEQKEHRRYVTTVWIRGSREQKIQDKTQMEIKDYCTNIKYLLTYCSDYQNDSETSVEHRPRNNVTLLSYYVVSSGSDNRRTMERRRRSGDSVRAWDLDLINDILGRSQTDKPLSLKLLLQRLSSSGLQFLTGQ